MSKGRRRCCTLARRFRLRRASKRRAPAQPAVHRLRVDHLEVFVGRRQLLKVRARDVRLRRSARAPHRTFATECYAARVCHGELLPVAGRKILCWHFAPMAETTHTSGGRLSALPRPEAYRGSGGGVYHGVRRWLKRSDPRAATGDTAHRRCVAADRTGQTACSRKRHCHFAIVASDAAQQKPGTKQQKLSTCKDSRSPVGTSTTSTKVLPPERHTRRDMVQGRKDRQHLRP